MHWSRNASRVRFPPHSVAIHSGSPWVTFVGMTAGTGHLAPFRNRKVETSRARGADRFPNLTANESPDTVSTWITRFDARRMDEIEAFAYAWMAAEIASQLVRNCGSCADVAARHSSRSGSPSRRERINRVAIRSVTSGRWEMVHEIGHFNGSHCGLIALVARLGA